MNRQNDTDAEHFIQTIGQRMAVEEALEKLTPHPSASLYRTIGIIIIGLVPIVFKPSLYDKIALLIGLAVMASLLVELYFQLRLAKKRIELLQRLVNFYH